MGTVRPKRSGASSSSATASATANASAANANSAATTTTTTTSKLLLRSGGSNNNANGNGGSGRHHSEKNGSGGGATMMIDPAQLLARGYTSRFLSPYAGGLAALAVDEIDKDVRHFEAYRAAVLSYRQQYYVAVNHQTLVAAAAAQAAQQAAQHLTNAGSSATTTTAGTSAADLAKAKGGPHSSAVVRAGGSASGAGTGGGGPMSLASLPVRIDVEEEKRMSQLRRKICLAEYHRENAEQQYVALRAHYVRVSRALAAKTKTMKGGGGDHAGDDSGAGDGGGDATTTATSDSEVAFLQECLGQRAQAVGLLRARLQMTRDVLNALNHRNRVLASAGAGTATGGVPPSQQEQQQQQETPAAAAPVPAEPAAAAPASGTGGEDGAATDTPMDLDPDGTADPSTGAPPSGDSTAAAAAPPTSPDDLTNLWNRVVDDSVANVKAASSSKKKKMAFQCTQLPATPYDVPLLLSALSHAPEKAVAHAGGGPNFFGANKDSLCWIEPEKHNVVSLPGEGLVDEDEDGEAEEVAALREEAAFLTSELDNERVQNESWCRKIEVARHKGDEWVAMICLLRQETEAVLFRHNVVLESDVATQSAERIHEEQQEQKRQAYLEQQERAQQQQKAAAAKRAATAEASAAGDNKAAAPAESEEAKPEDGHSAEGSGDAPTDTVEIPVQAVETGDGSKPAVDDANDGDDELGESEEEEGEVVPTPQNEEEGDSSMQQEKEGLEEGGPAAGSKRAAEDADEDNNPDDGGEEGGNKRRRKV